MVPTRIAGRHWLQTVAVRGCLIASILVGGCYTTRSHEPIGENEQPNPTAKQEQPKQSGQPTITVNVQQQEPAPTYESACKEAQQKKLILDVCQQWRMAVAAELQAKVTDEAFSWNKIEVLLLFFALLASASAAFSASRSVRVAQDIAKKELRATVYFAPHNVIRGTELYVTVVQGNSGQTPAKNVRTKVYSSILTFSDVAEEPFPIGEQECGTQDLAAGFAFPRNVSVVNYTGPEQLLTIAGRESETKIFVFAEATYTDVFGADRVTRASWFYIHSKSNAKRMEVDGGLLPAFEFTKDNNYIDHPDESAQRRPRRWIARQRMAFGLWIAGLPPQP